VIEASNPLDPLDVAMGHGSCLLDAGPALAAEQALVILNAAPARIQRCFSARPAKDRDK
jgi:hypothetical protein